MKKKPPITRKKKKAVKEARRRYGTGATERIEIRTSKTDKGNITDIANELGISVSEFLVSAATVYDNYIRCPKCKLRIHMRETIPDEVEEIVCHQCNHMFKVD